MSRECEEVITSGIGRKIKSWKKMKRDRQNIFSLFHFILLLLLHCISAIMACRNVCRINVRRIYLSTPSDVQSMTHALLTHLVLAVRTPSASLHQRLQQSTEKEEKYVRSRTDMGEFNTVLGIKGNLNFIADTQEAIDEVNQWIVKGVE